MLGIGLAVTVFRGAYEQIGNTFALWMRDDVDRVIAGRRGRRDDVLLAQSAAGDDHDPAAARAVEAPGRAGPRAVGDAEDGDRRADRRRVLSAGGRAPKTFSGATPAHWLWLLTFFVIFTLGELYILPNGLGIFARLAPPKLGASTVAAWYLAIFAGSLVAGQVGRLWSHLDHVQFFLLLAAIATASAVFLYLLDRPTKAVLANALPGPDRDLTDVPEGIARSASA